MPVHLVSNYFPEASMRSGGATTRDLLLAESNHRIANNLTLISGLLKLNAAEITRSGRDLSADEACGLLEEVGVRIETVGRLHRLLAQAGEGSVPSLPDYLREVAETAIASVSRAGQVRLSCVAGHDGEAPANQALAIGFVVGEAVINAVKYAHPTRVDGVITLGCHARPGGAILVTVADDGVGLPEGFNPSRDGGLGMRTVRALARQLGASLSFDSSGIGLAVRLLVPPALAS